MPNPVGQNSSPDHVAYAIGFEEPQTLTKFITGSRQPLEHLRLAALSQIIAASEPAIADAYRVWSERQVDQADVRVEIFAEQVAYVFFIRLLLIRVLEDKAILQPRLASDGGFLEWTNYINRHFKEYKNVSILYESFSTILASKAGQYYLHFFQRAIFDWFQPDDFLMVETLEFLSHYNFQKVASDVIGFTYEEYIDRTARSRKGHFLTRDQVVEYMLDLLDYKGTTILGRRILDPACGSGSFLVHAARRYRQALVLALAREHDLSDPLAQIEANPALRQELARTYLEDITKFFYGLELNPFACYLAEMNLLIQCLDDLYVLQQADDKRPIERFHIYNTDSLDLPREVLESSAVQKVLVPDRLSDRLTDEAYPIKAQLGDYAQGFFFIVCNPPYVTSTSQTYKSERFQNSNFYRLALSGDTNLYLLFLRLGTYYLAMGGRMVYIMPLTLFGDQSAGAIRKLLTAPPFSTTAAVRFYRGDVLFPGVDQAVGIIRVHHSQPTQTFVVGGGLTIAQAQISQFETEAAKVLEAVPLNSYWQNNWLVSTQKSSLDIWQQAKVVSLNFTHYLGLLTDMAFDIKQGDVNATYLNPFRKGANQGSFAKGDIAIYKGEDIAAFKPLPSQPSDWANTAIANNINREAQAVRQVLESIQAFNGVQSGVILREVARLNTRKRLIAMWFRRDATKPIVFANTLWRMNLKPNVPEKFGKALLGLFNSSTIVYLLNLFSTNNHVGKDEMYRIPIPEPTSLPIDRLAILTDGLLTTRARLENDFLIQYKADLPNETESVYLPPSSFVADLPSLNLAAWLRQAELSYQDNSNRKIKTLRRNDSIVYSVSVPAVKEVFELFLAEPAHQEQTWQQALTWQLPDPVVATHWLAAYQRASEQAQIIW